MKKSLKWIAAMLCLVMMLCMVGCADSTGAASGTASGSATDSKNDAPRELSLCMSQIRWGQSVDEAHMKVYVEALEKGSNTKIEMIAPTHNDYQEKLNVLMASGEYPDMILPQQAWDVISQFAVRGYLLPVTEYIQNDARFAILKDKDLSAYTSNGDIYGFPTGLGNTKIFWVRQDAIDKYGLEIKDTMTTDEFVTELRKIDKSETIPLVLPKHIVNFQFYYNFFGAYGGMVKNDAGEWIDGINTQEMKDAFAWLHGLYEEGLIDPEFITNENSNMREKFYSGQGAIMVDYSAKYITNQTNFDAVGKPTEAIPIYTLIGPNGDKGNMNESGSEAMALSATCKNPAAALDLIEYMYFTEAGKLQYAFGLEGTHYTIEDGYLTPTEAAVTGGYNVDPVGLGSGFVTVDINSLPYKFIGMSNEQITRANEIVATSLSTEYLGPQIKIPMGMSTVYDENAATYNNNLYEMATKIVMGTVSIEDAYKEYEQFWKSINGDEMLKQLNENYK